MAIPFMLGNFSGGLFQGAQSAFSLYQAYQGIQAEQYNLDAAEDAKKRAKEAMDEAAANKSPDAGIQTGDAVPRPAGYTPPSTVTGPVSPGRITQTALPPPAAQTTAAPTTDGSTTTAPPISPVTPPPAVEPGLVPTSVGPRRDYPGWDAAGSVPPGGAVIPPPQPIPTYTAPNDPGRAYQRQATGAQPGIAADVAAHDEVQPAPTYTAPNDPGRAYGRQSTGAQPGTDADVAAHDEVQPSGLTRPSYTPELSRVPRVPSVAPGGGGVPVQGGVPQASTEPAPGAPSGPGFLARTLASINPVGTAQAGELSQQDRVRMGGAAYSDEDRAKVGLPPLSAQERADFAKPTESAAPAPQGVTTAQPTKPAPGEAPTPPPVVVAGGAGKVVPNQQGPSVQSEPTPHVMGASVNPGPWARAQREHPELAGMLVDVVREHGGGPGGVTPELAAAVIEEESHWDPNADASRTKDMGHGKGLGQIEPGTQADLEQIVGRPLDPWNPRDNMIMTVEYLKMMGHKYGEGSFAQTVAYMRGGGGVAEAGRDPQGYLQTHPFVARRLQAVFGPDALKSITNASFPAGDGGEGGGTRGPYTPEGLVSAAQKGPDGTLDYMASYGPQNLPMSARWRASQALMEAAAIAHGRYDMIPHIRDYVAQESHAGALSNLQAMHQALMNGDPRSAALYGAKAHAFFPDGSYARFAVDKSNQLWAERYSEGPEHQTLGKPMLITPQGVLGQMMQLQSPGTYIKTLQDQQAAVSKADLQAAEAAWYKSRPGIEAAKVEGRQAVAETAAEARREVARITAEGRAALKTERDASTTALDKETNERFSDPPKGVDPQQYANQSEIYRRLRMSNIQGGSGLGPQQAAVIAEGLTSRKYGLQAKLDPATKQRSYTVEDEKGNQVATMGAQHGDLIRALPGFAGSAPLKPPANAAGQHTGLTPATPVGAGAGSMAALQQGYNQNLAGIPMQTQAA
jgi:hypothetical protein